MRVFGTVRDKVWRRLTRIRRKLPFRALPSGPLSLQHLINITQANDHEHSSIMADEGIDRKAEERMDFSTSKEVTVAPTCVYTKGKGLPGFQRGLTFHLDLRLCI